MSRFPVSTTYLTLQSSGRAFESIDSTSTLFQLVSPGVSQNIALSGAMKADCLDTDEVAWYESYLVLFESSKPITSHTREKLPPSCKWFLLQFQILLATSYLNRYVKVGIGCDIIVSHNHIKHC